MSGPTQDDRDRYGRLLRYVRVDGRDLGSELLMGGAAETYVFDGSPVQKAASYGQAEAMDAGLGMC